MVNLKDVGQLDLLWQHTDGTGQAWQFNALPIRRISSHATAEICIMLPPGPRGRLLRQFRLQSFIPAVHADEDGEHLPCLRYTVMLDRALGDSSPVSPAV